MLQNGRVTTFIVSELLREKVKLPPTQIRVKDRGKISPWG